MRTSAFFATASDDVLAFFAAGALGLEIAGTVAFFGAAPGNEPGFSDTLLAICLLGSGPRACEQGAKTPGEPNTSTDGALLQKNSRSCSKGLARHKGVPLLATLASSCLSFLHVARPQRSFELQYKNHRTMHN